MTASSSAMTPFIKLSRYIFVVSKNALTTLHDVDKNIHGIINILSLKLQ